MSYSYVCVKSPDSNQDVGTLCSFLDAWRENSFLLIQVVGKSQFLVITGWKSLFSCCLSTEGLLGFQRPPHSLARDPLSLPLKPTTAVSPSHTLSDPLLCLSLPLLRACEIRWGPLGSSRLVSLISGQLIRNLSSLLSCNIFTGSPV